MPNIIITAFVALVTFIGATFTIPTPTIWDEPEYRSLGAVSYPASLDVFTNPSGTDSVKTVSHSSQHSNANDGIEALQAKLGITASTPISGSILAGDGTGSSIWTTYATTTNINTGTLELTGSSTLQNFTFVNATGTNATTTDFFSTTGTFTNLFGTDSIFTRSTTTSATSTNFFTTTASSTTSYISNAFITILGKALDAGGFKITNLATPTNDTDAATKLYVDDNSGGEQNFKTAVQTVPDLTLQVTGGSLINNNNSALKFNATSSGAFTAPSTNDRIDLLSLNTNAGTASTTLAITQDSGVTASATYGVNWVSQTFTVPTVDPTVSLFISKVSLNINQSIGNPSGDFVVSIRSATTSATDLVSTTTIATNISSSYSNVEFSFNLLKVTPGEDYQIVWRTPSGNASNRVDEQLNTANPYAGGRRWISTDSGVTWFGDSAHDNRFSVTFTDGTMELVTTSGTEAEFPEYPSITSGYLPLAYIYNRAGQTSIQSEDDGTNGFILNNFWPFLEIEP